MILTGYEISLLLLLVIVAVLALIFHYLYLWRIRNNVRNTSPDRAFQKKELKNSIQIPQGSNFNVIALLSWNLLLVALLFLYFFTPRIFPEWNYFRWPQVASNSYGLAILGIAVMLIPGLLVSIHVPRVYGYYLISRWLKELNLLTPILLIISILCSVSLATMYPATDSQIWIIGYATLFAALAILLAPVFVGFGEEMR
jgi:hypothetical protein